MADFSELIAPLTGDDLCLAIDNGGTKSSAVLYTAGFRNVASAVSGSLRAATTPPEVIGANFRGLLAALGLKKNTDVYPKLITGAFDHVTLGMLREAFPSAGVFRLGEMVLGLSSSGIFGDGILALAGTGCTIYGRFDGRAEALGGYGSMISDEGSGYWISRCALEAAIKDYEDRGPKTALTAAAANHFGGFKQEALRQALFSIYAQNEISPVSMIAGFAPVVVKTAAEGDAVAEGILSRAGSAVAEQVLSLVRKNDLPDNLPLAISGSVWKKNPVYLRAFRDGLRRGGGPGIVVVPRFEPVCGAVAAHLFAACGNGKSAENGKTGFAERFAGLEKEFAEFVIPSSVWEGL